LISPNYFCVDELIIVFIIVNFIKSELCGSSDSNAAKNFDSGN